ncbi:phosphate uptake regulator PhoU [Nitratifractor sp.]|uniref:phosphate signaling complex PhoU family protein n=1 Tax=Nitratifractor sp. TaxID=2268144 RepID=UPI0025E800F2|nr:phosphate uptake regulator PhoU [Nitratifractor sp.]
MLKKYEEALNKITEEVYAFGELDEKALQLIVEGLQNQETQKLEEARKLLKGNHKANAKIDMNIITTLALYAPEASDLRRVVALIKIASELSRIGDYLKAHARNLLKQMAGGEEEEEEEATGEKPSVRPLLTETARAFYQSTETALHLALEAIKEEDPDRLDNISRRISVEESKCDDFISILEKNMVSNICAHPDQAEELVDELHILRKLERISDRSINIVKLARYALEGGKLKL